MTSLEFNNHFNQLAPILNSYAYNLTKSIDDAKDLYQETAYRAIKNQDKFRPGTNFKAWLFTIMKNIFINGYRKKLKANTFTDSTDNDYFINSGNVVVSNQGDSNIMVAEIKDMIRGLDESFKVPFMMHYSGYKYQEIAEYLELPLGTIKSRIFFARKELKELINQRYHNISELKNRA